MVQVSYPGVYVQEIPSGVRTISGVATSVTAFVGYTRKGTLDKAIAITSFADFERGHGGLDRASVLSYAVRQFYLNGGSNALIVRVTATDTATAAWTLQDAAATDVLDLAAANPGAWGNELRISVDQAGARDPATEFNLVVSTQGAAASTPTVLETHRNLSMDPASALYVESVVNTASVNVRATVQAGLLDRPAVCSNLAPTTPGLDGTPGSATELVGTEADKKGLHALDDVDLFNLLVVPETATLEATEAFETISQGVKMCEARRAFFIVDPPLDKPLADIAAWADDYRTSSYAAAYFPAIKVIDPLDGFRPRAVAPSGTLAGVYARTDATRGVWKAPAGSDATLKGVIDLALPLNDLENGQINPLGINALRTFPAQGRVAWGARTLRGSDALADEYKYIPIRRLALFIEESLFRGTQWIVFEPNDFALYAQIRLNIGTFMNGLFRQGAFQGKTPQEAYFVKCDNETTTQADRNLGIVNIIVGFAPLKPAEFVVLSIQQIAGDLQ